MNTLQIREKLLGNTHTRNFFGGVYPIDRLPKHVKFPSIIIVNTAPSHHPGKHWIAIYLPSDNNAIEIFDSYGRFLRNKYLTRFIKQHVHHRIVIYNKKQLQAEFSSVCGQYCCMYAYFRSKGNSMAEFLRIFGTNTYANDRKIRKLFKNVYQ